MKRVFGCLILVGCICAMSAGTAFAQNSNSNSRYGQKAEEGKKATFGPCKVRSSRYVDHRWFFNASPYLWNAGVFGDVTAGPRAGSVSASPLDTLEAIDIGAGFSAEVGWCKISLLVDIAHLDLSTDNFDAEGFDEGGFDQTKTVSHVAMNWNYSLHDNINLGPVAGVRHVRLGTTLGASEGDGDFSASADRTWIEPILGVRGRLKIIDPVYIPIYADVGGLGFNSEISWQAYGALGLSTKRVDFELGYRHLYFDVETDDFDYEAHTSGPLLRTTFRF